MLTIDRLKYSAKLSASLAFSFVKINGLGLASALIAFVGLITKLPWATVDGNGVIGKIVGMFGAKPFASVLALLVLLSPLLIFALGNKYLIQKAASRVIADKGDVIVNPLIAKLVETLQLRSPELTKKGADWTKVKLQMLQVLADQSDHRLPKRVATYGLKRVNLEGIDLGGDGLSLTEVVQRKTLQILRDTAVPSRSFFWIILGAQWLTLLLVIFNVA